MVASKLPFLIHLMEAIRLSEAQCSSLLAADLLGQALTSPVIIVRCQASGQVARRQTIAAAGCGTASLASNTASIRIMKIQTLHQSASTVPIT